jgi:hypothetical protein
VLSGLLLVLLGAWGALIPFIGPYFHYAYTPDKAWTYTTGRLWLEILPGVATALGGLILLASARRPMAMFGAFMAALGGAWFVVGTLVSTLWNGSTPEAGVPVGATINRLAVEELGFFIGLGVVIVFFAALALGRCAVVGVKDAALAERKAGQAPGDSLDTGAAQPTPSYAGAAAPAAASDVPGESFPRQEDSYQPAGSAYTGEYDESPTVSGRFPAADRDASTPAGREQHPPAERDTFTPAEREQYSPEAEQYTPEADSSPGTSQFPPSSPSGTVPQA